MRSLSTFLLATLMAATLLAEQVAPPKPKPRAPNVQDVTKRRRGPPPAEHASRLVILSDAPCRVWIDGQDAGVAVADTPREIPVAAGSHVVIVLSQIAKVRRELTVDVEESQALLVRLDLQDDIATVTAETMARDLEAAALEDIKERAQSFATTPWRRVGTGAVAMGCVPTDASCLADERPRRAVAIDVAFDIMRTEVTLQQFSEFAASRRRATPPQPPWSTRPDQPVVNARWADAQEFCASIRARLPTEAEWEYAARGRNVDAVYPWGDQFLTAHANSFGTPPADRWEHTAPVASFAPNDWGLYDMAGNVWEWVDGWYVSSDATVTAHRVARGGSWRSIASSLRASARARLNPEQGDDSVGFRCVRVTSHDEGRR